MHRRFAEYGNVRARLQDREPLRRTQKLIHSAVLSTLPIQRRYSLFPDDSCSNLIFLKRLVERIATRPTSMELDCHTSPIPAGALWLVIVDGKLKLGGHSD